MKRILLLSLIVLPFLVNAQATVKGIVTEQNSGNKPIAGVQIKVLGSVPEQSDNAGQFLLLFSSKKPGDRIIVSEVSKKGYEIVNKDVVNNWLISGNPGDKTKIVMCPEGLIAQNTLKYYDISLAGLTKGYQNRIMQLQEERDKAHIDARTFGEQAKALADQFKNQQKQLDVLADKFARENFDDCSSIHKQAFEFFKLGDIDEAIHILETINSEDEIIKAKKMKVKADSVIQQNINKLKFQGDLYVNIFRFEDAEKAYETAVNADTANFESVVAFMIFLNDQRKYEKSIKWGNSALKLAKTDIRKALIQQRIGTAYFMMNEYDKAEVCGAEALKIYKDLASVNPQVHNKNVAMALWSLAKVFRKNNQFDKSEANFIEAISILKALSISNPLQNNALERILALTELALLYDIKKDYKMATIYYSEAEKLCADSAVLNPNKYNHSLALIKERIGNLQSDFGEYEKAEIYYSEALKIQSDLAKTNPHVYNPYVAMCFGNLSTVQRKMKEYGKAQYNIQANIRIFRDLVKLNPLQHNINLAICLWNFAVLQSELKLNDSAEISYNEAVNLYREILKNNPKAYKSDLASLLGDFAAFQLNNNQYDKAEINLNESLKILRELAQLNPQVYNSSLASTLCNYAFVEFQKGNLESSEAIFNEAIGIYRGLIKVNPNAYSMKINQALNNYAILNTENRKYDKALVYYTEALSILMPIANNNTRLNTVLALNYSNIAYYLILTGKFEEAEISVKKGIAIDSSQQLMQTNLAMAFLFQGKYEEAKKIYIELKDKEYPEDKTKTFKDVFLQDLADVEKEGIKHSDVAKIRKLLK
ncbi:MAG: hypothetical protein ACOYO1_19280 [Bacteroidales bacterium]